jgi:hypothetical protein
VISATECLCLRPGQPRRNTQRLQQKSASSTKIRRSHGRAIRSGQENKKARPVWLTRTGFYQFQSVGLPERTEAVRLELTSHCIENCVHCTLQMSPLARRIILRKEVIQPQVPLRLPCYDLVPITKLTLGALLPCGLRQRCWAPPIFVA